MSKRACFRCDAAAGLEGLKAYESGGQVVYMHPSCFAEMIEQGSCCGDNDEDAAFIATVRELSPGGDA